MTWHRFQDRRREVHSHRARTNRSHILSCSPKQSEMISPHRDNTRRRRLVIPVLLTALLVIPQSPKAEALWQLPNLISLTHSLLHRVATLRSDRGDSAGAVRAREIADSLRLLNPRGGFWSLGWDYARNYAWRGGLRGVPSGDLWELLSELREFGRVQSDGERARWMTRNYSKVASLLGSVLRGLLGSFHRSGPLRDMVILVQTEVAKGNLLRDCMEVGAKDLEGLATIAREYFFSATGSNRDSYEL